MSGNYTELELTSSKVFESEAGVFQNPKEQTLAQIFAAMNWDHDSAPSRMVENQVGARLTDLFVSLLAQKSNQISG